MPTWQCQAFSLYVKTFIKRRPAGDETHVVRMVRAALTPPDFLIARPPAGASVQSVSENHQSHAVKGEWVQWPQHNDKGVILYLHGGGYVACSPATHRRFTLQLARATQTRVFSLDYRCAPEHRFPAAVEDATTACQWLQQQGIPAHKIVIAGDSAGGGLTLATLIALREQNLGLPRAAFCLSPWTDLAVTGASIDANENTDPFFYAEGIRRCAQVYLGTASPYDPLASPFYADLSGLPPILMLVSNSETLLDDSLRVAERVRQGGGEIELQARDEMPHVWPIFQGYFPEAKTALNDIAAFVARHLTPADLLPATREASEYSPLPN